MAVNSPSMSAFAREELIRKLEVQDDVLSQILLKCPGVTRKTTLFHAGLAKYPQPVLSLFPHPEVCA